MQITKTKEVEHIHGRGSRYTCLMSCSTGKCSLLFCVPGEWGTFGGKRKLLKHDVNNWLRTGRQEALYTIMLCHKSANQITEGFSEHATPAGAGLSLPTNVSITTSNFTSNVATDRGGAVNLQAGYLTLSSSTFTNNR